MWASGTHVHDSIDFCPIQASVGPPYSMGPRAGVVIASFYCSLTALLLTKMAIMICSPHSSVGKESACNAGDPGSSPGLGR